LTHTTKKDALGQGGSGTACSSHRHGVQHMQNMKRLIFKMLAQLYDGTATITSAEHSIVGSCINFKVEYLDGIAEDGVGYTSHWHTTCQHLEMVALLQSQGHIKGHDAWTKQVFIFGPHDDCTRAMYQVLDQHIPSRHAFHYDLLTQHLHTALTILNYEGDAEELVAYFKDYSIIEKQAWLWLMVNRPSIANWAARQTAQNILNHFTKAINFFPANVPLEVQIFAKWMERNNGGLFGQCKMPAAEGLPYTQTMA
jgi:hypothetical protein